MKVLILKPVKRESRGAKLLWQGQGAAPLVGFWRSIDALAALMLPMRKRPKSASRRRSAIG
ncbi:MAG: hypothetical protein J6O04_06070 [Selenomonadaceae bacterium]|nr:hypothetical protein [Selenomonadaceae bacterium]